MEIDGERDPSPSPSDGLIKLSTKLELQEFPDKFIIRSLDSESSQAFSIDRFDGLLHQIVDDSISGTPLKVSVIFGVIGTIRLLAGTYVLVITSRKEVGTYLGSPVFQVMSMKFLSCNEALKLSNPQEKKDEAYFRGLLQTVESTPGLYYSYEADLTLNLQRRCKLAEGTANKPLWKQADPRFVWNRNLLEELIEFKVDAFIIPLIQGSFQTVEFTLKNAAAKITLISRRCTRRLGTRMWRRGANMEGDTANFLETEQLMEIDGFRSSYLQIRGSIPLLWEQIVDLSYKPRLKIVNNSETLKIVERHFHDLTQRYDDVLVVDLTDRHGDEGQISLAFEDAMQRLPHIRYVSFDFHHNCGNANFDNIQRLYDQISEDIEKQGYFFTSSNRETVSEQKGIVRVNCIDCLDRTNVTQSFLGQKSLDLQLKKIGVLALSESFSLYADIYEKFRIIWVDQGDEISLQYAGTHALKRDLVRYGRQTVSGLIKDGMSALSRYYLNNFHDGIRQDAMDLISGHYTVSRSSPSPFELNGFESFSYLPVASALLIGGLTVTTFTLNQAGRQAHHFLSSVLWAGFTAGIMAMVKANGRQFCSRPRLCSLR